MGPGGPFVAASSFSFRYFPLSSSNSVDVLIFLSDRNGKKKKSLGCVAFLRRTVSVEVLTNMNY